MPTTEVKAVKFLSEDIFELTIERGEFEFRPGDCMALFDATDTSRPYSISSGKNDPYIRFIIRRIPGGAVSPWLAERKPGDKLDVSHPFGWFRPGQAGAPDSLSVFIATGTGIAPFLSSLRSLHDLKPLLCLYGVRHLADAVELNYLTARCPLHLAVSREQAPPHHHGRVTHLLDKIPLLPGTQYYLCGLDAMINEISEWLEPHGVDFTSIHREVFFNA